MASTTPRDGLAHLYHEFEQFMLSHKFVWDNKLRAGHAVPFDRTAVQKVKTRALATPEPVKKLSLRLQFLQQHSVAWTSPPSNTPSSFNNTPTTSSRSLPRSSSSSASSTSTLPLFTTEYFDVLRTEKKGYGAFASKDIEEGTVIMSERPLFKGRLSEVYALYEQLTAEERREYGTLWGWEKVDANPTLARFLTNRFSTGASGCGIFLKCSRFNHACYEYRRCTYGYDQLEDRMKVTTLGPIKKGEEITITYDRDAESLFWNYGFHCDCPGCVDEEEA